MLKKSIVLMLCVSLFLSIIPVTTGAQQQTSEIKNLIYMIPDGGGMAPFMLADALKAAGGFDKTKYPAATAITNDQMYLKDYFVGAETTHSANDPVTDSAASGTALATGHKTDNGMLGMTPDYLPRATILEASQELGKNTGLVTTFEWTNATPAAFSSHTESRNDTEEIAKQMLCQDLDVVLTATLSDYDAFAWYEDEAYTERGYTLIKKIEDLQAVEAGDKIWSRLPNSYYDITKSPNAPSLAELTETAIRALDDGNENGFFLMVEGSAVDLGGHGNTAVGATSEYVAFDEAFKIALTFAQSREDTAVIVMPDHDTGGMTYDIEKLPELAKIIQIGESTDMITWETTGHTGRNGGVFMYLPEGTALPSGIEEELRETAFAQIIEGEATVNKIDNTDIAKYAADLIGADLEETTKILFKDVTDMGNYNLRTGVFSFDSDVWGFPVKATKDSDLVTMDGETVSLEGRPCLYIQDRFYVPERLLNIGKTHTVTFKTDGGTAVSSAEVAWGNALTKPISPKKDGFVFDGWYTDEAGNTPYDFSSKVEADFTLYAKWTKPFSFTDVKEDDWFYESVWETYMAGLMNGVTDTTFAPNADLTRAMFVTILYRMEKEPAITGDMEFTDIPSGEYYEKPVLWAKTNGIVSGVSQNLFAPQEPLTREQMVAIIYRYAKFKGIDTTKKGDVPVYTDFEAISPYATEAVQWAGAEGIVLGNADGSFAPQNVARRAETATIFVRVQNLFK